MADRIVIKVPEDAEVGHAVQDVIAALRKHAEQWRTRGMLATSYGKAVADQCDEMAESVHAESRP